MTWWLDDLKRKRKTVKGDRCKSAKDSSTVKSIFSVEHKDDDFMNNGTYLGWMWPDPFYRELRMSLLV